MPRNLISYDEERKRQPVITYVAQISKTFNEVGIPEMAYMIQVAFSNSYKIVYLKLLKFSCVNFNLLVRVLLVGPPGHMKPSSAVGLGLSVGGNVPSSSVYSVYL